MSEIIIDFFKDGTSRVEAVGYEGSQCKEATDFLNLLGRMESETLKPEYYGEITDNAYTTG